MTLATLCLALAIYGEARGEPEPGMWMVAAVVMNRVESPRFPDTVCEVVNQPHQFSFTANQISQTIPANKPDMVAWNKAVTIAQITLKSVGELHNFNGATHYANLAKTSAKWTGEMQVSQVVGSHTVFGE